MSGLKGHERKMENIRKLGSERYRSGQSSLQSRVNKRLLKKYNWFRQRNNINVENDEEKSDPNKKKMEPL